MEPLQLRQWVQRTYKVALEVTDDGTRRRVMAALQSVEVAEVVLHAELAALMVIGAKRSEGLKRRAG